MIVVLFGPPGSGKGTQSALLTRDLALVHVSTGDMLRAEAARGSTLGREVAPLMASGTLVPDELIVRVMEDRLGREDARDGVVLDGFPRTVTQASALDTMLRAAGRAVDLVISLTVPVDDLVERLSGRARDEDRPDDAREVIHVRMREYEAKTAPVLDHYRLVGARVADVDGVGPVDQVRGRIHAHVADGWPDAIGIDLTGRRAQVERSTSGVPESRS